MSLFIYWTTEIAMLVIGFALFRTGLRINRHLPQVKSWLVRNAIGILIWLPGFILLNLAGHRVAVHFGWFGAHA